MQLKIRDGIFVPEFQIIALLSDILHPVVGAMHIDDVGVQDAVDWSGDADYSGTTAVYKLEPRLNQMLSLSVAMTTAMGLRWVPQT